MVNNISITGIYIKEYFRRLRPHNIFPTYKHRWKPLLNSDYLNSINEIFCSNTYDIYY